MALKKKKKKQELVGNSYSVLISVGILGGRAVRSRQREEEMHSAWFELLS